MSYDVWKMRAAVSLVLLSGLAACTAGSISAVTAPGGDVGEGVPDAAARPPVGSPDASVPTPTPDAPPPPDMGPTPTFNVTDLSRDSVLSIAEASVGYTYWWGHGSLGGSMAGTCTGSCPSCTHTGGTGADCSGFVGKAWMLPEGMPIVNNDEHPFSTYSFVNSSVHWSKLSRSDVLAGDAMVYNTNGSGHIFLYESDDPWGQMWTYEARGCSYGIVHNIRTAGMQFGAIRRDGL
jgi:hypothetical protein